MSRYIFKLEGGELVCKKTVKGKVKEFVGEDAVDRLNAIDELRFKRATVGFHGIQLENERTKVYIYSDVLFNENNYQNCLYKNMKKINKAVVKWNKKANDGKKVFAGVAKGIATGGILTAIGIAMVTGALKDHAKASDAVFAEMEEDFDFESAISDYDITVEDIKDQGFEEAEEELVNQISSEFSLQLDYGVSQQEIPDVISTDDLLSELEDSNDKMVNISFNDEFDTVKYNHVISNYYNDTEERASRWGVSTNLALSFISQESGGYVENLMQVQWGSWADVPITVFNFEKNEYEKIILTTHPEDFQNQGITQFISKEDLKNPKTNISIGCIIIRYCFDQMNHNMTAAIQAYNFGVNNMNKVLDAAAADMGCTREDLLNNQSDTSFLNYRYIIDVGDPKYVENTLRFLQDPNEAISIRYIDENGEQQEKSVFINNDQSTRSL